MIIQPKNFLSKKHWYSKLHDLPFFVHGEDKMAYHVIYKGNRNGILKKDADILEVSDAEIIVDKLIPDAIIKE